MGRGTVQEIQNPVGRGPRKKKTKIIEERELQKKVSPKQSLDCKDPPSTKAI